MSDKITKALNKLFAKEKDQVRLILKKIKSGALGGMDVKRLKGNKDIFRVRKGDLRVIYRSVGESTSILTIERRSEKTYKDF